MRQMTMRLGAIAIALVTAAVPAFAAMTAEEAVAKNIAARGGAEKWKAIRSFEATGQLTSFSKTGPFTLKKTRDHKYHLDAHQDGIPLLLGFDGKDGWMSSPFFGDSSAQRMRGPDVAVAVRDADFPNPFFDYKEQGHELKLIGEKEFEGQKGIAIELKRKDGQSETWYLDPKTFLEFGRESPGSDFGRPVPQRSYYDDFRDVGGVKIPFHVESQWYTRERIFTYKDVKLNVEVDEAIFRMPPPPGMGPFLPLVGDWKVAAKQRGSPQGEFRDAAWTSKIDSHMGGAILEERFTTARGTLIIRTLTYDRYRKHYKLTEVTDQTTYLDIMDGTMDDKNQLVVSNVASGTASEQFGTTVHTRMTIKEVTPDGFTVEEEASMDGGKEWFVSMKAAYTRDKK